MGSLRRVMDTHTDRGRQRTLSYPRAAPGGGLDEVPVNDQAAPPRLRRPRGAPAGAPAPRSIRIPGHLPSAHEAPAVLSSIRGSEGCAASRAAISTRSRITIIRRALRFRAPSSGAVRRSRSPWYCIVQAHLVRRLVARLTGPERRQPQHTARLAHVRLTGRRRPLPVDALRAEMDTAEPSPSSPAWARPVSHHGCSGAPGRTCRPSIRGSSALASGSLSA